MQGSPMDMLENLASLWMSASGCGACRSWRSGWTEPVHFSFPEETEGEDTTCRCGSRAAATCMCVPVCVFGSGSVWAWGRCVSVLPVDQVIPSVNVSVCLGVWGVCVCVPCTSVDVPLGIFQCVLLPVCLQYVTARCVLLCLA